VVNDQAVEIVEEVLREEVAGKTPISVIID